MLSTGALTHPSDQEYVSPHSTESKFKAPDLVSLAETANDSVH